MSALVATPPVTQRVQYLSRLLAHACLGLIVLLPLAVAIYWSVADASILAVRANLPPNAVTAPLQSWQRVAGAVLTEGMLSLLLLGLWQARRCFQQFSSGQIFTGAAVQCLRHFAGWTLASVIAGMLSSTAISVVLTLGNPPGLRHIAIGVGTDQLFTVFFAALVWLMAAVIGQGQALAEENATFI